MEPYLHLIVDYLPLCSYLRLVSKGWKEQLEYNDKEIANTIWKVKYPYVKYLNKEMRLKRIILKALCKGDLESIRLLLCTRSKPIKFIRWSILDRHIEDQSVIHIIMQYISQYSKWKSILFDLLAKSIHKGYTSVLREYIPSYVTNLYYIFARVKTLPDESQVVISELNIDVGWYLFYLGVDIDTDLIISRDPWILLLKESARICNKTLVYSILKKRAYELECLEDKRELIELLNKYIPDVIL